MNKEDVKVVARECRFAIHIPEKYDNNPDLHLVKEQVHYSDGSVKPALRWIKEFKRDIWVTKRSHRVYKDKREWSALDELDHQKVTQSNLRVAASKMLGKMPNKSDHMKKISQSPYLYGTDITSTSLIKKAAMDAFPNHNTPFTLATYDVETDVLYGTEEINMATVIFKRDIFITITEDFMRGINNPVEAIQQSARRYIGEYLDKHQMTIHVHLAKNVVEVIGHSFSKVHELKPDWLAIWNMDFDIPKILENLERYGEDPRDYLCDPMVPKQVRVCRYKQGPKKKVTASGKVIPINPAAQWHTLICTASFYVIDAMCAYKHLRLGEQEESSYSLDAILALKLGIRKLKFKEADEHTGLKWHQFMQSNYKVEYCVYNIFDCLSMIELDHKTKDLAYTLPSFAATTDFANFKSQPRRIADALHFYALQEGYVMGTVGSVDEPVEGASAEVDEENTADDEGEEALPVEKDDVLSRVGWVLTLPPLNAVLGLPFIQEDPTIKTGIRAFVYDSDAVSSYPSDTSVGNVSKSTTKRELIRIEGIDEDIFRMNNLNLVLGQTNAIEYAVEMFGMPKPEELLNLL